MHLRVSDGSAMGKSMAHDVSVMVLKQEAIKWIKSKIESIEKHSHKAFDTETTYMDCIQCGTQFVQLQWIKHFFNITEEEISNAKR